MTNLKTDNSGCDCGPGCCEPPKGKGKLWTKIVFVVIVCVAAAIVTVKLVTNNSSTTQAGNDTISGQQTEACGDTTGFKTCVKVCDPSQCCPQARQ
jgi:hypothetical protein